MCGRSIVLALYLFENATFINYTKPITYTDGDFRCSHNPSKDALCRSPTLVLFPIIPGFQSVDWQKQGGVDSWHCGWSPPQPDTKQAWLYLQGWKLQPDGWL